MQLFDLNLDRFLYRSQYTNPDTSATALVNSTSPAATPGGGGSTPPVPPPGSIITGVILQSSNSDNRIEINPDDTLKAYNNGNVVLLIDKNGIVADNGDFNQLDAGTADITVANINTSNTNTANVNTLNVATRFFYKGIQQPVLYTGVVTITGAPALMPAGWTSALISTGIYRITHNLNIGGPVNASMFVFTTPLTGHFRVQIAVYTANYFEVWWQQTSYGNRTFPVSGGPGNVTVQGVRIPPNEEPVNVAFTFLTVLNLQ